MRILLVVDMVNDFCRPDGALYIGDHIKECVDNVKDLLAEFREAEDGVIFLCDSHQKEDPEFRLFPAHCIQGSHGETVIDDLEPEDTEMVIEKATYSGVWRNGELLHILDQEDLEIYVCGVCTSICVMETVADLYKEGLEVKIVEKACCDIDSPDHDMAINRMRILFGAEII